MRLMTIAVVVSSFASVALAQDVAPPPPFKDYAEASYVGLSYIAVCAPARTYTVVLASPFGDGPRVQSLALEEHAAPADDLAQLNSRLASLKSFSSLTIRCATDGDLLWIDGYAKATDEAGLTRVVVTLSKGRVVTE